MREWFTKSTVHKIRTTGSNFQWFCLSSLWPGWGVIKVLWGVIRRSFQTVRGFRGAVSQTLELFALCFCLVNCFLAYWDSFQGLFTSGGETDVRWELTNWFFGFNQELIIKTYYLDAWLQCGECKLSSLCIHHRGNRHFPGIPLTSNTFQLLLGDPETFPGQIYNPSSKFWVSSEHGIVGWLPKGGIQRASWPDAPTTSASSFHSSSADFTWSLSSSHYFYPPGETHFSRLYAQISLLGSPYKAHGHRLVLECRLSGKLRILPSVSTLPRWTGTRFARSSPTPLSLSQ